MREERASVQGPPRTKGLRTRGRIVAAAARMFRERGFPGTAIAGVMREVGLTVGGFYAHFASKEVLFAEAVRAAIRNARVTVVEAARSRYGAGWSEQVVARYLGEAHRDDPGAGCSLPTVVSEMPRHKGLPAGLAFDEELERLVASLADGLGEAEATTRGRAVAFLALLVGGLALARATGSRELSDEILRACRNAARAVADPASTEEETCRRK